MSYPERFLCDRLEVMKEVVAEFEKDKPKKRVWGNFRIVDDKLVYRCYKLDSVYNRETGRYEYAKKERYEENIIAIKINGKIVGNSSILNLIGSYSSYGNFISNRTSVVLIY